MQDIVAEILERIRDMTIRRARRIACAGASALGEFAREYAGNSIEAFRTNLVQAAHEARTQFCVCGETYKFFPMTMSGDLAEIKKRKIAKVVAPGEIPDSVKVLNLVFDSTPAQYIDAIITEVRMICPPRFTTSWYAGWTMWCSTRSENHGELLLPAPRRARGS